MKEYKRFKDIAIYKKNNKYAVVYFTETNVRANNYHGNGQWTSNKGEKGIDYVADWVSLTTANKRFKELVHWNYEYQGE